MELLFNKKQTINLKTNTMNCGKQIFYKNNRLYTLAENGVDCIPLNLSGLDGRVGSRGPDGPNGSGGFNFGVAITSNGVAGSGLPNQGLTATPSVGAIGDYSYAWALVSRDTVVGQIDPVVPGFAVNAIIVSNPSEQSIQGMARVRVTHTATGTIQEAEFMVMLAPNIA